MKSMNNNSRENMEAKNIFLSNEMIKMFEPLRIDTSDIGMIITENWDDTDGICNMLADILSNYTQMWMRLEELGDCAENITEMSQHICFINCLRRSLKHIKELSQSMKIN